MQSAAAMVVHHHHPSLNVPISSGDLALSANELGDEKILALAPRSPGAHVSCPETTQFQLN